MNIRRVATGVAALVAGGAIAGCSSSAPSALRGSQQATSAPAVVQWWSGGADYCAMLRQTMRAGHSILPGAAPDDPKLLAATKAFVSDLTAAAPSSISAQWRVLGPALIDLVESGGKLAAVSGVNTRLVADAATAIAADAKSRCQVDVSA